MLGAENRHDQPSTRQQPGQRQLWQRTPFGLCNWLEALEDLEIAIEILRMESRVIVAAIARLDVRRLLESTCEKSPAERRVRHEPDSQLSARCQDFVLRIAGPQRVLALNGRNRMNRMGAPDRAGSGF